ncbi:hypothetical protein FB451DRAFT_1414553 [Mycena latifolia]|nr:hypothetical protein FB451DRAFT_1414553 [Mycena latifolia]
MSHRVAAKLPTKAPVNSGVYLFVARANINLKYVLQGLATHPMTFGAASQHPPASFGSPRSTLAGSSVALFDFPRMPSIHGYDGRYVLLPFPANTAALVDAKALTGIFAHAINAPATVSGDATGEVICNLQICTNPPTTYGGIVQYLDALFGPAHAVFKLSSVNSSFQVETIAPRLRRARSASATDVRAPPFRQRFAFKYRAQACANLRTARADVLLNHATSPGTPRAPLSKDSEGSPQPSASHLDSLLPCLFCGDVVDLCVPSAKFGGVGTAGNALQTSISHSALSYHLRAVLYGHLGQRQSAPRTGFDARETRRIQGLHLDLTAHESDTDKFNFISHFTRTGASGRLFGNNYGTEPCKVVTNDSQKPASLCGGIAEGWVWFEYRARAGTLQV